MGQRNSHKLTFDNTAILALLLVGGAFLLLFATRAAQQTGDSLVYALAAKTGQDLFHPHHILYSPMVRLIFLALVPICDSCDAVLAGQLHNILWAVVTVVCFFVILRRLLGSRFLGLLAALLLLVTRGVWELSTQTTVYVPALGGLALLVTALVVWRETRFTLSKMVVLALLLALSVLYHQANVLFSLPLGYYLVTNFPRRRGWAIWLGVVSLAGVVVLTVYILAFLSTGSPWSVAGFLRFCLAYTFEVCLGGQCKASPNHWGTVDNFGAVGLSSFLDSLSWNFVYISERFRPVVLPLAGVFLMLLVGWNLWQTVQQAPHSRLRGFFLTWLVLYLVFFFWWLPTYPHPLVLTVFPMLILALLAGQDIVERIFSIIRGHPKPTGGRRIGGLAMNPPSSPLIPKLSSNKIALAVIAVLILGVAAVNFKTNVWPLHQSKGDSYVEASELAALAPQECTILTSYRVWNYLRYYHAREKVIQTKHPLGYFYQHESLPEQYRLEGEKCVFILASYVTPGYTDTDYSASGSNGYSQPAEWLAFMEWLLGLEYDSNHTLIASRTFEVVALTEGGPYLSISPAKAARDGLADLFQTLDSQMNSHLDQEVNPFQSWLAKTHPLSEQGRISHYEGH